MNPFFHLSLNHNPPGCRNGNVPHVHRYHQLIYCTSGEGGQCADGWKYAMRPGDLFFIPAGTEHRSLFAPDRRFDCFVLDFQSQLFTPALPADRQALEIIDKLAWFRGKVPLSPAGGRRVQPILEELLVEFRGKGPAYQAVLKMMTLRVLIAVARDEDFHRQGRPVCPPPSQQQMIREVLHYLDASYMKDITVESVLKFCPLSRSHFHAVFKRTTGTTLVKYLRDIRLKKAKEQLRSTDAPIADVAAQSGLGTASYFGQLFRSATGVSPRDYRQRYAGRR